MLLKGVQGGGRMMARVVPVGVRSLSMVYVAFASLLVILEVAHLSVCDVVRRSRALTQYPLFFRSSCDWSHACTALTALYYIDYLFDESFDITSLPLSLLDLQN